jgi:hypothetical protein
MTYISISRFSRSPMMPFPIMESRQTASAWNGSAARTSSRWIAKRSGVTEQAMIDINHLLRPGRLRQLAAILGDPQATENDRFVAFDLLKNANIAAGGVLPMCQDTGTAIVMAKKGRLIFTDGR